MATLARARRVKEKIKKDLAGRSGLAGIGIRTVGEGFGIEVLLSGEAAWAGQVPREIDGVPVLIRVVGSIRPHEEDQ